MLIAQVCDFGDDGDARYRALDPSRQLALLPDVTTVDCHFFSRHLIELSDAADVLVLHFVNDWDFLDLCLRRRKAGKVTVFEANDYYPDLQPWHPRAKNWQDGTLRQLLLQFLKLADGVQTSTPQLATRWQAMGARQIAVFQNHLCQCPPLAPMPDRPLTVGWGGSPGHLADWYAVCPVLQKWLDAHPEVHLAVMTAEQARPFLHLKESRCRFTPFSSLEQYQRFLQQIDVGLAPLLATDYNRCRSDVKFLEYASRGVAGIYAALQPYQSVVHGQTGLVYHTADELVAHLDALRTNPGLREAIRSRAHEYVSRERRLVSHVEERLAWYKKLLQDRCCGGRCPAAIADEAQREGNYLRLTASAPEQMLQAALRTADSDEADKLLAALVERYPKYVPAVQYRGVLLNNRRQFASALVGLEAAQQLGVEGARLWSEIGRARFHLGNHAKARDAMERAVQANPYHLPAWEYLLRMLTVTRNSDGPAVVERARGLFPDSLLVALLAAAMLPPREALDSLLDVLERLVPALPPIEHPTGLGALGKAILAAVRSAGGATETEKLLRRACEIFPTSAALAAELAALLFRAGCAEEAHAWHARALNLHRQAACFREEFAPGEAVPLEWQLSDAILRVSDRVATEMLATSRPNP